MDKRMQLFCIPYAGGMADVFRELPELLGDGFEVTALEYAGHGRRKTEPFYRDFGELADDIAGRIKEGRRADAPFAVFGYSMGSVAAYEVITRRLGEVPEHIFLASHEAPDVEWDSKKYETLDDDAFMDELITFGGFGEKDRQLLKNRFFYKLYFRPIREDYRLLANYRMEERHLLPADTTVFYSPDDPSAAQIESWSRFAGKGIEYIPLGHDHFFIRQHAREIAQVIRERCGLLV